jgi:phosphoglucosamine mutase
MTRKYFGTDGVRGRVGQFPMTPDFVLKLGWAAGKVLANGENPTVLIGKDTRISGYMMESALQAGLVAAGVNIRLLGPMPTPAIAYLTRAFRASAGVVISASHNPYYDNGVKFFSRKGTKLPDEIEEKIEYYLDQEMEVVAPEKVGKVERIDDAAGRYIEFCKRAFPLDVSLKHLRIVVDCANGATYHVSPHVFSELRAEIITIGNTPDGTNINDKCGATSLSALQSAVNQYRADVGIALDGDGDRLMMVDEKGEVVDGDEVLAIITAYRKQKGSAGGGVVGTLMSNLGLEKAVKGMGLDFYRAKVGDRYVMETMQETHSLLGGESSGHIIVKDRIPTGDGTIAALQVLGAMVKSGKTLHELKQVMQKYPQTLVNVRMENDLDLEHEDIQASVRQVEEQLGDRGRVLLRKSGTEPLVRVMVEGVDEHETRELAETIAGTVRRLSEEK